MSENLFVNNIENIFLSEKTRQKILKTGKTQITETGSYVPHITGVTVSRKGVALTSLTLQTPINLNLESPTISAKALFFQELSKTATLSKKILSESIKPNEVE